MNIISVLLNYLVTLSLVYLLLFLLVLIVPCLYFLLEEHISVEER